ncbi:uncharacterized protein LOC141606956 [Silene latifolia]|uniref:uncharacterized protein LOC141606956 n=1 Tax=Silene latifolia TaxID=37657 RepID=UPI003D781854
MGYFDGEWESICKLLSVEEQPDFSFDDLLVGNNCPNFQTSQNYGENLMYEQDYCNYMDSSESNDISLCFDVPVNGENDGLFGLMFVDSARNEIISTENVESSFVPMENYNVSNNSSNPSTLSNEVCLKRRVDEEVSVCRLDTPKKKGRTCKAAQNKKNKAQSKGKEDPTRTEPDEKELEVGKGASLGCDNSEDDLNETEDSDSSKSLITTTKGKKRASRGEATDPQSLYARRRRRRINERLRILQGLVPNGTKVDISTMLEEAFNYVKFLQLQIRLLSSDDLWMYAPMAYSGFDVSVYGGMLPQIYNRQIN